MGEPEAFPVESNNAPTNSRGHVKGAVSNFQKGRRYFGWPVCNGPNCKLIGKGKGKGKGKGRFSIYIGQCEAGPKCRLGGPGFGKGGKGFGKGGRGKGGKFGKGKGKGKFRGRR